MFTVIAVFVLLTIFCLYLYDVTSLVELLIFGGAAAIVGQLVAGGLILFNMSIDDDR
jgi:hypothetical protein